MTEFKRWRAQNVEEALKVRRVVVISGARQTGKTTLAKQIPDKDSVFRPLDKKGYYDMAKDDPAGFIQHEKGTMVIDEIQKVKELIPEIKYVVDNNNRPGQYLLTGSANLNALPDVSESMAGRLKNIRLRPLTQGEIFGKKPVFLEKAFERKFPMEIKGYDKKKIFEFAFRGGFPEAVKLNNQNLRKDWHDDYIETLMKYDLRDVANIQRHKALKDLVKIWRLGLENLWILRRFAPLWA